MVRTCLLVIWLVVSAASNGVIADQQLKAAMFDLAPWAMKNGNSYRGIVPSIIREMEQQLGKPIATTMVAYPRMIAMLEAGDVDFAIFFQSSMSRKIADPLYVFYHTRTSVIVPKKTNPEIVSGQRRLRIATARGVVFDHEFDTSKRYIKVYSNDHPHSVQLLVQNRVDGVAGPEDRLLGLLRKSDPEGGYQVLQVINTNKVTLQFSKKSKHMEAKKALQKAAETIWTKEMRDKLSVMFP